MKEELQQIQAVALTTFLLIILSIHNSGEYGEWFEISGMKEEILEPGKPEMGLRFSNSNTAFTQVTIHIMKMGKQQKIIMQAQTVTPVLKNPKLSKILPD